MNRLIKFRQAHMNKNGIFKHFSYWGTIDVNDNPSLDGGVFSSPTSSSYSKSWHQQFTGRVDCHGKEIYEGDIIKQNGIANSVVVFEKEKWYLKIEPENQIIRQELGNQNSSWIEVIGHINQNPELLKIYGK